VVAAFGWSGEAAYQVFAPASAGARVRDAFRSAGAALGLVEAGPDVLEILRIEAGIPRFGRELGEDVLPAEARLLDRAVSFQKGCYTGQEIVARMRSRGEAGHLLCGLRCDGDEPPDVGAPVRDGERRVGEVTSAACSPHVGCVALAFLMRPHDAAGTRLTVEGRPVEVAALPFVEPSSAPRSSLDPR
jgi:folate-binding protein YgfZ